MERIKNCKDCAYNYTTPEEKENSATTISQSNKFNSKVNFLTRVLA